jgi:RNA polymerase sigma-70 factor (ECF subfamily)
MASDNTSRLLVLLAHLKKGEMEYFNEFYELTKYPVYYSLLPLTKNKDLAEEMMLEAYVKFLQNIARVKKGQNPLAYLLIVARNTTFDHLKKESRETYVDDYVYETSVGAVTHDEYDFSDKLLEEMSNILNETEFEVVILYVLSGLTHKEISDQLKKPIGTITWTYSNAIKKLQKGLANYAKQE